MGWQSWALGLGGLALLVGHWVTGAWLDVIGGALIAIAGFGMMSK